MNKNPNLFIEGLQGAGKSTLVNRLAGKLPNYTVLHEGDYSPVELSWCSYVTEVQYQDILTRYQDIADEIEQMTVKEGEHRIIRYTQILTDIPGFHKDLEQYEIYNGALDRDPFEKIVLERYRNYTGDEHVFECSVFQNIITEQLLYFMMTDDEILTFYKGLKDLLHDKNYRIIYLDVEDIRSEIEVIKNERSDTNGNELWFPLIVRYIEASPYGKKHGLTGMEGLLAHLEQRKALEHRIIKEIFPERTFVVKAKDYNLDALIAKVME